MTSFSSVESFHHSDLFPPDQTPLLSYQETQLVGSAKSEDYLPKLAILMLTVSCLDATGGNRAKNTLKEIVLSSTSAHVQHKSPVSFEVLLWQRKSYMCYLSLWYLWTPSGPCTNLLIATEETNVWKVSLTNFSGVSLWQPKQLKFFWSGAAVPWYHVNVLICTVCSEGWWCLTKWPPALLSKWLSTYPEQVRICKDIKTNTGKNKETFFFL